MWVAGKEAFRFYQNVCVGGAELGDGGQVFADEGDGVSYTVVERRPWAGADIEVVSKDIAWLVACGTCSGLWEEWETELPFEGQDKEGGGRSKGWQAEFQTCQCSRGQRRTKRCLGQLEVGGVGGEGLGVGGEGCVCKLVLKGRVEFIRLGVEESLGLGGPFAVCKEGG